MNLDWQNFLIEQGAQIDDTGAVTTFGHGELERFLIKNGPVVSSQAHQGLLKITGEDAFDFLQGQLTNDLNDISAEKAQYSAYCDPQGNVLANFLVFKVEDAFYLTFDFSLKESIQKRLQMFVMRSKVTIEDISDNWIHVGFAGEFADLDVQRLLSTKVKEDYQVASLESEEANAVVVKVPGPYHRYSFFAEAQDMQTIWKKLKNNSEPTNNFDWRLLDIVYGVPTINSDTAGQFTAQFLNLDKLEAINFKKGCFPGQEIIARIHYRGKVTKRMMRLHLEEVTTELTSGAELVLKDSQDKKYKFQIISSNPDVLRGTLCLAVTTLKPLELAQSNLMTEQGSTVSIEPLPYDLTEE